MQCKINPDQPPVTLFNFGQNVQNTRKVTQSDELLNIADSYRPRLRKNNPGQNGSSDPAMIIPQVSRNTNLVNEQKILNSGNQNISNDIRYIADNYTNTQENNNTSSLNAFSSEPEMILKQISTNDDNKKNFDKNEKEEIVNVFTEIYDRINPNQFPINYRDYRLFYQPESNRSTELNIINNPSSSKGSNNLTQNENSSLPVMVLNQENGVNDKKEDEENENKKKESKHAKILFNSPIDQNVQNTRNYSQSNEILNIADNYISKPRKNNPGQNGSSSQAMVIDQVRRNTDDKKESEESEKGQIGNDDSQNIISIMNDQKNSNSGYQILSFDRKYLADNYMYSQENNKTSSQKGPSSGSGIVLKGISNYTNDKKNDDKNEKEEIDNETNETTKISIKLFVDRRNISKKEIFFLDQTDTNNQLNEKNIKLFIDKHEIVKFQKYLIPKKTTYTIKLILNKNITNYSCMFRRCEYITEINFIFLIQKEYLI